MADPSTPTGATPSPASKGGPPMGPYPAGVHYPEPRAFPTSGPSLRSTPGNTAPPPAPGYSQYLRKPPVHKPSSGSHTLAITATALAIATAVVLVVGIQIHNKNNRVHTYAAPAGFGNYSLVTGTTATQQDTLLTSLLTTSDHARFVPLRTKGTLAVYSDTHHVTFGAIYLTTKRLGSLGIGNRQTVSTELLSAQIIADGSFVEPRPSAGQAWCGNTVVNGSHLKACTWSGSKTSGIVLFTGIVSDASTHAALASFRQALEE